MTTPEPLTAEDIERVRDLAEHYTEDPYGLGRRVSNETVLRLLATLDARAPLDVELVNDVRALCHAVIGGTSYRIHRDEAESILARVAAEGSGE